jgi:hypothetical protein
VLVGAAIPWRPREKKVSRSLVMPAPEEGSKPAMVRTFFIELLSIFCKNIAYFGA